MDCNELVEVITAYLEGDLAPEEVSRLEEHLGECPGCRLYLQQMRQVIGVSGRLREDDLPSQGREELLRVFQDWKKGS